MSLNKKLQSTVVDALFNLFKQKVFYKEVSSGSSTKTIVSVRPFEDIKRLEIISKTNKSVYTLIAEPGYTSEGYFALKGYTVRLDEETEDGVYKFFVSSVKTENSKFTTGSYKDDFSEFLVHPKELTYFIAGIFSCYNTFATYSEDDLNNIEEASNSLSSKICKEILGTPFMVGRRDGKDFNLKTSKGIARVEEEYLTPKEFKSMLYVNPGYCLDDFDIVDVDGWYSTLAGGLSLLGFTSGLINGVDNSRFWCLFPLPNGKAFRMNFSTLEVDVSQNFNSKICNVAPGVSHGSAIKPF